MRILMIGPGGIAMRRPVDWALKAGYEVYVLGDEDFYYQIKSPKNYHYFPRVFGDQMAEEMAEMLGKLADEIQPDIIHVYTIGWYAKCCVLANLSPLVVSAWGFLNHLLNPAEIENHLKIDMNTHDILVRQVLNNTGVLIVETPNLIEKSRALLTQDQQVELIPLGANTQHFRPGATNDLSKWRREVLKISENVIVLSSPRGWSQIYNHEQIFTAYAQAYPQFIKPTVLVFLPLPRSARDDVLAIYKSIFARAEELGLLENLRLMPPLPYSLMPTAYNLADVIINYPTTDAFPSTIIEAVACECPVITCNLLAYQGTFIEEFCTLVEPENPAALAEAMIKIVNQPPQEREKHLAQARQVIVKEYDEAISQKRMFQVYENLASKQKR